MGGESDGDEAPFVSNACLSLRAVVHIQVNDVNEFAPVFREPQYRAAVTEGKIYDSILQVEASDQDCSPQYSQICNYQITTSNSPFAVDRNGETFSQISTSVIKHSDRPPPGPNDKSSSAQRSISLQKSGR